MRLKMLLKDHNLNLALTLAGACVRSLRRNNRLHSVCDQTQVNYMLDVYIVILTKYRRTKDIIEQVSLFQQYNFKQFQSLQSIYSTSTIIKSKFFFF